MKKRFQFIDSSEKTHVPLCPCGWRGEVYDSKQEAYASLVKHEARAHPNDRRAHIAAHHYGFRHAGQIGNSHGSIARLNHEVQMVPTRGNPGTKPGHRPAPPR